MNFIQSTHMFLENLSNSSAPIYKVKIDSFSSFLKNTKGINDSSYRSYLEGMKISEIIEAMDYYIESNNINSQSIANHYSAVIKRYFVFLYENGIQNDNLIKSFGLKNTNRHSYKYRINTYINSNNTLKKKKSKEELSFEEFEIVISECDINLQNIISSISTLPIHEIPSNYNDLTAFIIIKLTLLTGATYRTIRDIKRIDYSTIPSTLRINNFEIYLPKNLSFQINEYVKLRDKLSNPDSVLFITEKGEKLSNKTSLVSNRLDGIISISSLTSLLKFSIIQMIENGVNQSIIQEFTGVGEEIYTSCQREVNRTHNNYSSRYLDAKLRKTMMYDRL